MRRLSIYAAIAMLLLNPPTRALADGYWAYSNQNFDVVTADRAGGEHALTLARNVARFEKALVAILNLSERHVPTHIYELPSKDGKELLGDTDSSSYMFNGYEVVVVTSGGTVPDNPYWGALFGYTGSLLMSRAARYPHWFKIGVPQLFSNTRFGLGEINTGGSQPGFIYTLQNAKLIPMRVFLRVNGSDPQLQSSSEYRSLFEAESWLLAREVFVENKLRSEFGRYLSLMKDGKSEEEAFSASFKITYEDLDKLLVNAMREPTHVFVVKVPREAPDGGQARKLTTAEAKARLADLNLRFSHRADALRLASEALDQDGANELALRTRARASLQEGDFTSALTTVDRLSALPSLSAPALTDCGDVLLGLAFEVSAKHASVAVDLESLRARAKDAYERAVGLDSEYLPAWAGLANLYSAPSFTAAAQALVPRAQPVMEKHPDSGPLARALATMCARTGQISSAFLFGEFWRSDAVTDRDRDQAEALLAKLQTR